MIVDGFVSLVDYAARFLLLLFTGRALLDSPEKVPALKDLEMMPLSNMDKLFPSNSSHRLLYLIRVFEFTIVTLFRFVWAFIAMIFVSNDLMYKTDLVCLFLSLYFLFLTLFSLLSFLYSLIHSFFFHSFIFSLLCSKMGR